MDRLCILLVALLLPLQVYAESIVETNEHIAEANFNEEMSPLSLSFGYGIPYGILGLNLNYRITDNVEIHTGIGTWGPTFGGKFYPDKENQNINLGLLYGPNTITGSCINSSCDILDEGYSGLNAIFGYSPSKGEDGWEFGLVLILTREGYDEDIQKARDSGYDIEEEGSKIMISFGYRWSL